MKWMEIIKLRVADSNRDSLAQQLAEIIPGINLEQGLREIKLYRRAVVDSDVSIYLYWESKRPAPHGSAAGFCLMHMLKAFGLISHSVWIEKEDQEHAEVTEKQRIRKTI